jgi:hypothetical protein
MRGQGETEPTLSDILNDVWAARAWILVCASLFAALAFLLILATTPEYRASMIVAPADGYALGDYASSVSDGEKLAIPFWRPQEAEGVSTDFHRFVFTLRGPAAADILLKDSGVLSGIARDGRWSKNAKGWTAEELADYLDKRVRIQHLGATPLRKITYHHPDPVFAASFLRKMHLVADQLIRRDRRRQSESRIKYLKDMLGKTVNPDHRRVIADLLSQQEHIQMLANLDEAYAAIIVEPPSSSPRPVWPDKALLFGVFLIAGGALGYFIHTARKK